MKDNKSSSVKFSSASVDGTAVPAAAAEMSTGGNSKPIKHLIKMQLELGRFF